MSGPVAWFPYLERGDVDLGVLNMWDAEKGYLGESMYEKLSQKKGFSIGLVCMTVPNAIGFVVAKDGGIKTIADLKGKRVAANYPTPSIQLQTEAALANANLTIHDVISVPANSPPAGVSLITNGRADASSVTVGTPAVDELKAKPGALFLSFDPSREAVERMRKFYPGYMVTVTPGPGRTGIEKETNLWAYDTYLVARTNFSDEAVYTITKALWENYKDLGSVHQLLKNWQPSTFISKNAIIPFHPGAIRFYKEKGVWTREMEALQRELLAKKKKETP